MDELLNLFRSLAGQFDRRWARLNNVLVRIRAQEGSGVGEGTRSRNILLSAFGTQVPVETSRAALRLDRANALKKLGAPLRAALGHIITIQLADQMLAELDRAERDQVNRRAASYREGADVSHYSGLIDALRRAGVPRGHYSALSPLELDDVARDIKKKVERRLAGLPELRLGQATHGPDGRRHMFWDPYDFPDDFFEPAEPSEPNGV